MPCRSVIFSLDSDEEKRRRKGVVAKVNVAEKFGLFEEHWSPKIIGELNDFYVKAVKFKGEFVWHDHETEDEMFYVVKGRLRIKLRDGEVTVDPGEFVVIPRKVEHLPIAEEEVHVLLLEPKTTVNTGQADSDRRRTVLERI
jgi:mannose-6-phosphate isomerase-like protein (cupin superfamily)